MSHQIPHDQPPATATAAATAEPEAELANTVDSNPPPKHFDHPTQHQSLPPLSSLSDLTFEVGNPAVELIHGHLYLCDTPPPIGEDEDEDENDASLIDALLGHTRGSVAPPSIPPATASAAQSAASLSTSSPSSVTTSASASGSAEAPHSSNYPATEPQPDTMPEPMQPSMDAAADVDSGPAPMDWATDEETIRQIEEEERERKREERRRRECNWHTLMAALTVQSLRTLPLSCNLILLTFKRLHRAQHLPHLHLSLALRHLFHHTLLCLIRGLRWAHYHRCQIFDTVETNAKTMMNRKGLRTISRMTSVILLKMHLLIDITRHLFACLTSPLM